MRRKLFLSSIGIIIATLLLSMFSVNMVFRKQFSVYLTLASEVSLEYLPNRLSSSYLSYGYWNLQALGHISTTLPLGTEVVLKDRAGETILTLANPMDSMILNGTGMGMHQDSGMSYSVQEWKTKTLDVKGPDGVLAVAVIRYPASARLLNAADKSFVSAIYQSLLMAGSIALLIGVLLSYWISRRLLSPLQGLTKAVHRVGEGHLDERVSIETKDEVGELATAFNDMADKLKKQEHLRKQFSADIAHELRTPLTSIKSYIEAFQDGVLQPDTENLIIINEEIDRLVTLSSDLKDLNVAEIGALKPHFSPINAGELLDKVISKIYPLIQEKDINLTWEAADQPITIHGDEHLLTRLLYNLIHNAYKYTPSNGWISIQIEDQPHNIRIQINDSGVGIAEEELPFIFERFYRADKSRSRKTGGTGIGLALVQQIIQLHHGRIEVKSTLGEGSEFIIFLPKNPEEPKTSSKDH
jgi:signal transduction histidine kinase